MSEVRESKKSGSRASEAIRLARVFSLVVLSGLMSISSVASAEVLRGEGWGLPKDVSEHGHYITSLLQTTLVLLTIAFVIMVAWIAISVFKHNEKHEAKYELGTSRGAVMRVFGIAAAIFFIIDGNLWVNSTIKLGGVFWNFDKVENDPATLRIEVVGRQWVWQARYAGPDGEFNTEDDAIVTNDIRVPIDTPIYMQLASPDVIHAFYLPNFRNKQDVVPGMINRMWFTAKETGEYEIGCAQHCGQGHYLMSGKLIVLSKEEFALWLKNASKDSARIYDAEDSEANWGWKWRKPKE